MALDWYKSGSVTVRNGSKEIVGTDTDWLIAGIKEGDIFVIDNQVYEIDEVTASTNLILVNDFEGTNAGGKDYAIIQRAEEVLQAEIAEKIENVITAWNEREANYIALFNEIKKILSSLISLDLGIDIETEAEKTVITNLPIATATRLGGVKIGNNINVTNDGTISADVDKEVIQESLEKVATSASDMNEMLNEVFTSDSKA